MCWLHDEGKKNKDKTNIQKSVMEIFYAMASEIIKRVCSTLNVHKSAY